MSTKTPRGWLGKSLIVLWLLAVAFAAYNVRPEFWKDAVDYYRKAVLVAGQGDPERGVRYMKRALRLDPTNTGYLVTRGGMEIAAGQFGEAEQTFEHVLARQPDSIEARFGLAEACRRRGQPFRARAALADLDAAGLSAEQRLRRARMYAAMGGHREALADLDQLLQAEPDSRDLLREAAPLCSAVGQFDRAVALYGRLAELEDGSSAKRQAREGLATALRAAGQPGPAYELYRELAAPENLQARAELAMELGRLDEAEPLLGELLKADSASVSNALALATLHEIRKEYAKALPLLEGIADRAGDGAGDICRRIANLYRWLDQPAAAVPWYRKAAARLPEGGAPALEAREGLALALLDSGDAAGAAAEAEALIQAAPAHAPYLLLGARAATAAGQPLPAVGHLARLAAVRPLTADERMWMGGEYARAGRKAEAREALLAIPPGQASDAIRQQRAAILGEQGFHQDALADVGALLAGKPADPALLRQAAMLQSAVGRFAEAAELYGRLAAAAATEPDKREAVAGQAVSLRANGRPADALALFKQVAGPENLQVRADLAMELKRLDEAEPLYRELLATEAQSVSNTLALATLYEMKKDYAAAIPLLERSIERAGPRQGEVALRLANTLRWTGKPKEALPRFRQALAAIPADPARTVQAREGLALASLEAGDAAAALAEAEALVKAEPAKAEYLVLSARAATAAGQTALAVERLEQLGAARALSREERVWLAGQYRLAARKDKALKMFESVAADASAPAGPEVLEAIGDLRADLGDNAGALTAYLQIPEDRRPAPLYSKIGRVADSQQAADVAIAAYTRYLETSPGDVEGQLALATLLIRTGRHEAGAERCGKVLEGAGAALAKEPKDLAALRAAARASSLLGRPADAVEYLNRLAAVSPPDLADRIWLAGEYRAAGDAKKSAELHEALLAEKGAALPPAVLEAAGDLRADAGDFAGALAAFQMIPAAAQTPALSLKIARAAQKRDPTVRVAVQAYRDYLKAHPDDAGVMLEVARFFVNVGELESCLALYSNVIAAGGGKGLGLEIARAHLAAERFAGAETYARQAVDENGADWRAQLALAQSLHLQGKLKEADDIVDDQRGKLQEHPEGREWLGLVAMARDRHLEAFRIFDALARDEQTARRKYWIWRGRAAQSMGDLARAKESYDRAEQFGAAGQAGYEAERRAAEAEAERVRRATAAGAGAGQ